MRDARTSAGYGRFLMRQQNSRGVSALLSTGCARGRGGESCRRSTKKGASKLRYRAKGRIARLTRHAHVTGARDEGRAVGIEGPRGLSHKVLQEKRKRKKLASGRISSSDGMTSSSRTSA